jgi:hypothetical protein
MPIEQSPDTPDITGEIQASNRTPGGRFIKGQSGNPAGRPKSSLSNAMLAAQALLDEHALAIMHRGIGIAAEGYEPSLIKLFVDRILPRPKDAPVQFNMPSIANKTDLEQAQIVILQAVAEGKLTPTEGINITKITENLLKTMNKQEPA